MARPKKPTPEPKAAKGILSIEQLVVEMNARFGKGTLVRACDAKGLVKPRISTGSFSLDAVTGGGFPEGGIEILEGDEGTSKSWSLHCRARNFLAKYPDAAYILVNAEGTNDPAFLEMLGVDLTRTFIASPNSGEEAWDAIHFVAEHASKVYTGIDSLDQCPPLTELESEMDENKMAPAARMNNRGFRKLVTVMRSDIERAEHRFTLGVICQLRSNIGVMFGDPNQTVGGRGKNFAASMRTRYARVKRLATEGDTIAQRKVYGLEIEAHIIKNKGMGEGEKVRYTLYKENYNGFRRGQIDNVTELIPFLLLYRVVEKEGSWFVLDGQKYHGEDKLAAVLRANDALRDSLCEKVREQIALRYDPPASAAKPAALSSLRKSRRIV